VFEGFRSFCNPRKRTPPGMPQTAVFQRFSSDLLRVRVRWSNHPKSDSFMLLFAKATQHLSRQDSLSTSANYLLNTLRKG
jgi:hypothetical protein